MPVKKSKSQTTHKKTTHQKTTHQKGGNPVRKSYKKTQKGAGFKKSKNAPKLPKKSKNQTGGKLNAYFKLMLDARKRDLPSFSYNGKTYKQITAKTGLKMYKKV